MIGILVAKFFLWRQIIMRCINRYREKLGFHICSIYDDKHEYYTLYYYWYNILYILTGMQIMLPDRRFTVKYLMDDNVYYHCFAKGVLRGYVELHDEINLVKRNVFTKTLEDMWSDFKSLNEESKTAVTTYKKIRSNDIVSVQIDNREVTDVVKKYVNAYYMLNNSLTLTNMLYFDIHDLSTVTIVTKKFGEYETTTHKWSDVKDKHIYFLF